MKVTNAFQILGYGVVGLGFLLAFLSYRLLLREQKEKEPRPSLIRAIYIFMAFSVVLCGIGLLSEFIHKGAIIGDPIQYIDRFRHYEHMVAELSEKAEKLKSNPDEKKQDDLNLSIHGLVNWVNKERQYSKLLQENLNGELEKVAVALNKGDTEQINDKLIVLNRTLERRRGEFRKSISQVVVKVNEQKSELEGSVQENSSGERKPTGFLRGE